MNSYKLNLSKEKKLSIPEDFTLIFLCGSSYNKNNSDDKRIVLRRYLEQSQSNKVLILEDSFPDIKEYGEIDFFNLYDIETAAACFANAVIIIHESLSTAAELGMMSSNFKIAPKLLVLYPHEDVVEDRKISAFIRYAFLGTVPILNPDTQSRSFIPAVRRWYVSNDNYVYHTKFPTDINEIVETKLDVDTFLRTESTQPLRSVSMKMSSAGAVSFKEGTITYKLAKDNAVHVHMSPMALRTLLFGVMGASDVQEEIDKICTSPLDIVDVLEAKLKGVLKQTLDEEFGIETSVVRLKINNAKLTVHKTTPNTTSARKVIGLFVFLMKSMNYIASIENQEFKVTSAFKQIQKRYKGVLVPVEDTSFSLYMGKANES